jgi:hypothetical protein
MKLEIKKKLIIPLDKNVNGQINAKVTTTNEPTTSVIYTCYSCHTCDLGCHIGTTASNTC